MQKKIPNDRKIKHQETSIPFNYPPCRPQYHTSVMVISVSVIVAQK